MKIYNSEINIKQFLGLLFLVTGLPIISYSQSIPPTDQRVGAMPCAICTPTGWFNFGGTPDMSNKTTAATNGTSGGGTSWVNGPLLLPPNNHVNWITIRDIGNGGTEESVGTNITGLTAGREYEMVAYTLSAIATYSPVYIDKLDFQVENYPRVTVSPINKDIDGQWGISRFKFIANAPTMEFAFFPGNGAASNNYESVNISVTLNAINTIPVIQNKSATTNAGTPVTIDVLQDALDYDSGQQVMRNSIDLDPSTPGIQNTIALPGVGIWSVDHMIGLVTFVPESGYTGTATIQYTIQDNFTLDGSPSPGTSTPKSISVQVESPAVIITNPMVRQLLK